MSRHPLQKVETETKMLRVCGTCPWLLANQGQRHKAGWYTVKNLRRLWNGLRTGKAPGMVCHSSDPESIHYGGDKAIKDGIKHECAGALNLVITHVNELSAMDAFRFALKHPISFTKAGLAYWIERQLLGPMSWGGVIPPVENRSAECGLPWEQRPAEKEDKAHA